MSGIWGQEPVTVPDTACACIEKARKEGVAQVRTDLTDAIHRSGLTAEDWRRLAAKVVARLRGL